MSKEEVLKMRVQQILTMNVLSILVITVLTVLTRVMAITLTTFLILIVILLVFLAFLQMNKSEKMNFIFKKITKYEREKLGEKWDREQKYGLIFILFVIVFFIFLMLKIPTSEPIILNSSFYNSMATMGVGINIGLYLRAAKVEKHNEADRKNAEIVLGKLKIVCFSIVIM